MNIIESRTLNGLLGDDKVLSRALPDAVSKIAAQVNLMSEMFPYMMTEAATQDSFIPVEYLIEGTDKFQEQLNLLRDLVLIMDQIENLRSEDASEVTAAMTYFAALNAGKQPFPDRYK